MPRAGATPDPLQRYRAKRDFRITPEPDAADTAVGEQLAFVIQKHDATRLHYDFRLEWGGVLLSWAVPKGPSLDPAAKRMAVRTEDHPLSYGSFEGTIPPKQYGAGEVIVWDRGTWQPVGDAQEGLDRGKLAFVLHGHKLQGLWELVRMKGRAGEKQEAWLLFKKRDTHARPAAEYDVLSARPDSVMKQAEPPPPEPAPTGAVPAAMPETLSPQLATLASAVPLQGHWIFENKFDGYRLLTRLEGGAVRLFTRNGHDWTDRLPALAAELATLRAASAWIDGEIVVQDASGRDDFNALQNAFDRQRTQAIRYVVFDLPYFEGHDLREAPLAARRDLLRQWLQGQTLQLVQFSEALGEGAGKDTAPLMQAACDARREGLIAKRDDAPYRGTRSTHWLKLKCQQRQEFVVAGYTARSDDARAVGSLVLAIHDGEGDEHGALRHAGNVGTGWDMATARALMTKLKKLNADAPPFEAPASKGKVRWPGRHAGLEQWVKPRLVVEVSFAAWTPAGHVRHAAFVGLRRDKPPRAITREEAVAPDAVRPQAMAAAKAAAPRLTVTHPERVIDDSTGLTKLDLVRYVDSVADFLLPQLQGRPVALLRAPGGIGKPVFFQRHGNQIGIPGLVELDPALWPGHDALLEIRTREALVGSAQMNVVEFHTWNALAKRIGKPDRMVFDLDPGEGVEWPAIREGAQLVRALLDELALPSWIKTSGGKGLHVVVPIKPLLEFDTVKAFSKAVVQHLADTIPARFVVKSGPANRQGRIFVDYLRNGEGATTVTAYSARARPGLGVSMPIAWDELDGLKGAAQWTIANARDHLSLRGADPWADLAAGATALGPAMKALGFKPAPSG